MNLKRFNEANIDLDLLSKRGQILVNKLRNKEQIEFDINKEKKTGIVTNSDEILLNITDENGLYDHEKSKKFFKPTSRYAKLIEVDGVKYQVNNIFKNKDFGSSGGSSLGTNDTRIVECIQCLFLSYKQLKRHNQLEDSDYDKVFDEYGNIHPSLSDFIRVPIRLSKEILDNYSKSWTNTFIVTSNALYENRPVYTTTDKRNALDKLKNYIFYHIEYKDNNPSSNFIEVLYKKYRSFTEVTSGVPISKWTPSDIWAVDTSRHDEIIRRINSTTTFTEFNDYINQLFMGAYVRGVSLKKIGTKENVKIVLNRVTRTPNYTFSGTSISSDPLSTIGIKLIASIVNEYDANLGDIERTETIDLRISSGERVSDINGEVIGYNARHGKIGLATINQFMMTYNIPTIKTKKDIISDFGDNIIERLKIEIKEMNDYLISLNSHVTRRSSVKEPKAETLSRLISKWQALKLGISMYENGRVSNRLIQDMLYYAMALRIKGFRTPGYIRII